MIKPGIVSKMREWEWTSKGWQKKKKEPPAKPHWDQPMLPGLFDDNR
jgi:hypothetical protein